MQKRNQAILLIGPTGAGKSPLGDLIQQRGLPGRRFLHFDFGENLRFVTRRGEARKEFTDTEIQFICEVLDAGRLLENKDFHLAERMVRAFLERNAADDDTIIVLNGLPRHVGQANDVDRLLDVQCVLHLDCPPEIVQTRIRMNVGGDRTDRVDDDINAIRKKLTIFHERTTPLLNHYREKGCLIQTVPILATDTPEDVWCKWRSSESVNGKLLGKSDS